MSEIIDQDASLTLLQIIDRRRKQGLA